MKQIVVAVVILLSLGLLTEGQPAIKIGFPSDLAALYPNGIDERPAMFGVPSYATSISGRLIWATVNNRDSCATFNNTGWPTNVPLILLIDRGVCSFVSKVRLAQDRGAVAAIIVDDRDEAGLPYMADDGTGNNIAIPSALIHKNDGAQLKARLDPGGGGVVPGTGMVTVTMTWSLPRPDNRVEYDLWSNTVDELSRSWKNNWLRVSQALGEHAKFTPRQWIIDGRGFGCTDPSLPCRNQCVMSGRFCAVDPDHDLSQGVSGADVVRENLRQICLANYLNATNYYDTSSFFLYQKCFQTNCYPIPPASGTNADMTVECSTRCLATINVTWNVIDTCIQQSGGYADVSNITNTLLEGEMNLRSAMGIFYLPTLLVNLTPYRGSLVCPTPVDISHCGPLNMICQGYQEGTKPDACNSSPGCWPGEIRDGCGICGGNNASCADCLGEPYGLASEDYYGTCCKQSSRDICNICFGKGYDSCGLCPGAPSFNRSNCCPDGSMRDVCGTCGGTETVVSNCPGSSSIGVGGIIGISLGCVAVAAAGVFCYMRRQQNALKNDIDSLLKQYLPLDAANSLAHPSRDQTDGANLIPESAQGPSDL